MTDLRKAAEMALDALDAYSWEQVDAARTALRQALAQPEQEPVAWVDVTDEGKWSVRFSVPIKSLPDGTRFYTAPVDAVNIRQECVDETAKGEHEPVAWMSDDGFWEYEPEGVDSVPLYAAMSKEFLEKFAALVRQEEREACAFICDGISDYYETRTDLNQTQKQVGQLAAEVCGVRIRERQ